MAIDGFTSPGAAFTASSSPPIPQEPEPVPTTPGISMEHLLAENQRLQEMMLKQSQEADRKITSVMEQNQLLNQTIADKLMDLNSNSHQMAQQAGQDSSYNWETAWEKMYGGGYDSDTSSSQQQPTTQQKENAVDPKLVRKLIREETPKVVSKIAQKGMEAQQAAQDKQKELMDRFTTKETDLHPWANEVVALWNRMAKANPNQGMEERYTEVMEAARELFGGRQPQPRSKTPSFPTAGQTRGGGAPTPFANMAPPDPAMVGMQNQMDVRTEMDRKQALEDYVVQRKKALRQRSGYFAQPGQG